MISGIQSNRRIFRGTGFFLFASVSCSHLLQNDNNVLPSSSSELIFFYKKSKTMCVGGGGKGRHLEK